MVNLGVCKGPGNILGEIHIGSDSIQISKIGRHLYTLLNNKAIMMARSKKELFERVVPVLSYIIKNVSKNVQSNTVRWKSANKNYTEMLNGMLKAISENLRPVELFVLKMKPDEIQDNTKIDKAASFTDREAMIVNMNNYCLNLKRFGENLTNLRNTSEVLLRTDLDKGIWGSKEVMAVLNDVKVEIKSLEDDFEVIEGCLEHSDKYACNLRTIISQNISTHHTRDIIGNITENFSQLKSFKSVLAQVLLPLYKIDASFKSHVGYPATWFFNSSIFHDFLFEYESLIDNMVKCASLESKTIETLLVWKIKLTGE